MLDFTGNLSAPTASVTTAKCVFNSVVSTPGASCLLADIKNIYLNHILPDPESMRIPLKIIPQEIIDYYNLTALVEDQWWIYIRIEKGMYGFTQAGIIANQELVNHMSPFGYHPVQHTPDLWLYDIRGKEISLVVDDFCFQSFSTEDSGNLF